MLVSREALELVDAEIASTRQKLAELTATRARFAAELQARSAPTREIEPDENETTTSVRLRTRPRRDPNFVNLSLTIAKLIESQGVLAVPQIQSLLAEEGVAATTATLRSALHRGATTANPLFERFDRGRFGLSAQVKQQLEAFGNTLAAKQLERPWVWHT